MNIAIILAAGASTRARRDKIWADKNGQPVWTWVLETLRNNSLVDHMVWVVKAGEENGFKAELSRRGAQGCSVVVGGETRMESFLNGLAGAREKKPHFDSEDILWDLNAANPNMTQNELAQTHEGAKKYGAAAVAHACVDTLMEASIGDEKTGDEFAVKKHERGPMRQMQTPQAVRGDILEKCLAQGCEKEATDLSTALIKRSPIKIVAADAKNKKITTEWDLEREQMEAVFGEDSHAFVEMPNQIGKPLLLAGVPIAGAPQLVANSDGDVVLHAIGRALAALTHQSFSEVADPMCQQGEQNSQSYLKKLSEKLKGKKIVRVTVQIEAKTPTIDPHRSAVEYSLSRILDLAPEAIHLSAMTGEGLTPFGQGKGIRALAMIQARAE